MGARVRRLRFEADYNFDAFVEETGLGRGYISELERGLVVPSLTALENIATALEVTIADLVLGSSERERLFDRARRLTPAEVARLLRIAEHLSPPGEVLRTAPFKVVPEANAKRHRAGLPLLSLTASAGGWSAAHQPETEAWVVVRLRVASKRGLFVAKVSGHSMEPGVPDGAFCLFQRPWTTPKAGEAGIFVRWEGDTGGGLGAFTLKEYRPEAEETEAGDVVGGTLGPRNPSHSALLPGGLEEAPERAFARLLRVLP